MKKMKTGFLAFLSFVLLVIATSTFYFGAYWAEDPDRKVATEYLSYFHNDYETCRSAFRKKTKEISDIYDSVEIDEFRIHSSIDNDLTVDWAYIPAQNKMVKLLILNSGLHGIEGYTGSAIQLMFMDKVLIEEQLENTGVLLIHGLNPYGFKYYRKVTENNVDLNRNCVQDTAMYHSVNEGYGKLSKMLMPEGEVNRRSFRNLFFHIIASGKIAKESMPVLRQAALQGQYEHKRGLYYGGTRPEPQIDSLSSVLSRIMCNYKAILNIDLHTAYGERGFLHLFHNPIEDKRVKQGLEIIFTGVEIDWGSEEDFYTINGEYTGFVKGLSKDKLYLPMLFEFGTMDSQKTFGALKSIQVMINENQGAHYGYKNDNHKLKIKSDFKEMYYPSSEIWRTGVMSESYEMLKKMMENYTEFQVVGSIMP